MYCKKCGTEQKPGQKFCPKCGTPFVIAESERITNPKPEEDSSWSQSQTIANEEVQDQRPPRTTNPNERRNYKLFFFLLAAFVIGIGVFFGLKYLAPVASDFFGSGNAVSEVEGIPFKSSEKGKWGMLKPDGTILFEEEFKDMPTTAHCGRFMVRNGNRRWEIFTATETPEKVGDEYVSIGEFYNGVAPAVKKNERISLIDIDGNVIAVLEKSGSKSITMMENFHYGYAIFQAEDAAGIVNTKGEILLEAKKYCMILHVAPRRFLALDMKYKDEEDKHNLVYDIIDPVGNPKGKIRMSKYDNVSVLADGYMCIEQTSDGEKLYGIMDLDGEVIVKPTSKIRGLSDFNDGKFFFSNGENIGVRNIKDEVLIRAKYDGIIWATDRLLWVNSSNEGRQDWTLITLEGEKVSNDSYQNVLPFLDGKNALVQITDKTWGMVNHKGEELKDIPDIYTVSLNSANEVIVSDYLDLDAIVSALKMTPDGFGGFGINMPAVDLVKVYNEHCEEGDKLKLDPNEVHTDKLSYHQDVLNGVNLSVELYYSGYMTERGENHFDSAIGEWIQEPTKWTKESPQYIKMRITGHKLAGKTTLLYKKLAVKAKALGQVYKENDHACIIVRKNGNGLVIVDTGSEIWGMVKNNESLRNENIEQYSNIETRKGASYSYEPAAPVDTDTIEDVIDSIMYDINGY